MRRKGLIGKETESSDSFISSLEYSFTKGDNLMGRYNLPEPDKEEFEKAKEKVFSGGDN